MSRATPVAVPSSGGSGMWHSLRVYPALQLVLLGTMATNTAFWMYQIAVGWLALQLLNSPFFVGLTGFAGGIPLLIISMPAGMIIDRFDRRRLLLLVQFGVMVLAGIVAVLVATDTIAPWSLLLLVAAYGTVMSFVFPVRTTIVSAMVAREHLANAVALNAASQNATRVIGPALAGVLIAVLGLAGTFAVAALLQILALITTIRLPEHTRGGATRGGLGWESLTLGLRVVAQDAVLVRVMLLALATNILVMPYLNLMPVFARDVMGLNATGLGLLMASIGLGTVVGALLVAHSHRIGAWPGTMVVTATLFSALVLIFSLTTEFHLAIVLLFASGLVSATFLALAQTTLQLRVDDAVRGRVLAIYLLTWGMLPIGQLAVGAVASSIGPQLAMSGFCVLSLACVAIVSLRFERKANS
jgi:MFS family permease